MSLPLAGLRVWITRPGSAAQRSASHFADRGAACALEPAVRLDALELNAKDRAALEDFLPHARLVLTSANAARYFVESLEGTPQLLERVRELPVSALGEATARAATECGLRVEHLASVALGIELAREVGAEQGVPRVILPGSQLRRPETEAQLLAEGIEVLALTVYETLPVQDLSEAIVSALKRGELDAIALYSPSAVHGVIDAARHSELPLETLPPFLALGPTTAAECDEVGHPAAVSPMEPGEAALLEAVAEWWKERGVAQ